MDVYVKDGQNILVIWQKNMPEEHMKKHVDCIKSVINSGILQIENSQRLHIGTYDIANMIK